MLFFAILACCKCYSHSDRSDDQTKTVSLTALEGRALQCRVSAVKLCLTVGVSLSRAFPLVTAAAVLTPLQGGERTVGHTAGLYAHLGVLQTILLWGWLWGWGQVYKQRDTGRAV